MRDLTPPSVWRPAKPHPDGGGGGGRGSSGVVIGMRSGKDEDLEGSTAYSSKPQDPGPSDIRKSDDDGSHRDNLPQMPSMDLSVDSSAKTQDLHQMQTGEEKYRNWQFERAERLFRLQRAWLVHSAWASIENVCKISSNLLVNKIQCEHIADDFKATGGILKKLGLDKDFVSSQALEGGSGVQTELTFDEQHFNHIVKTFEGHFYRLSIRDSYNRDLFMRTRIQDVSSKFEDYVRELEALDGSSEESLFEKPKISEDFQDFSLWGIRTEEDVDDRFRGRVQFRLDEFLCLLLGVLKQGEDLVMFHSGLEAVNNGVVQRTGLYGEEFVQIHELLYKLLKTYHCLQHCKGTKFAHGYSLTCDSCRTKSLLYYLNSNCLGESASLSIDDTFILNMELSIAISELLARPNCVLKTLYIGASPKFGIDLEDLRKCRLMVIAALSKCASMTSLTVSGLYGEEVHELCKSLSANTVLEKLVISTHGFLPDNDAMNMSAMLKVNHKLKNFTLEFDDVSPKGAADLGAMLAENSSLEELNLRSPALGKIDMRLILWPLMTDMDGGPHVNSSLKHLGIVCNDDCLLEVAGIFAQLLCTNKTLTHFSMDSMDLDHGMLCKILDSLKKNRTLQVFSLQGFPFDDENFEVATCLEALLVENSTLEELTIDVCILGSFYLKYLLRPLMANKDGEPHVNISLKRLHILNYFGNQTWHVVELIAQMLGTNKTLTHFSMIKASLETSHVCEILDSLKTNKTLQVLNLFEFEECKVLDNPWVKEAFMDLLVDYNFTLHTIKMHGRDWDIEGFLKLLEAKSGVISESPTMHGVYEFKQVPSDLKPQSDKGSTSEGCQSSMKALKGQRDLIGRHPTMYEKILVDTKSNLAKANGFRSKLEVESQQFLEELKPSLEAAMKSTDFLLRRNLNMAQILQERYSEWNSFVEMYPSKLTNEEKNEFEKGCIIATLFPTTFLYHLKAFLLQGPNSGGILHTLKKVADLVIQRMKSLQDCESQTFEFIDYDEFQASYNDQHIRSLKETIAISQTFSTRRGIVEELQVENSKQYGIVQDHLTGIYCFDSVKSSNLDKPNFDKSTGVIGVKVTTTKIQVEIMWKDGSYYFGTLEDFCCDQKIHDNKQCAFKAFGHLKGASFLKTCGIKCSPLLIIALAMAIDEKGLTLTWNNGQGHIQTNSILPSLQPMELEVWECQILYGGDINQLGEAIEWGMNQLGQNHTSSSRDNQRRVFFLERDPNQAFPISNDTSSHIMSSRVSNDTSHDASNDNPNNAYLSALSSQYNAGAQDKKKVNMGLKVLGSGPDIGFEIQTPKGKMVEAQAFEKIQELNWKEEGGYVIVNDLDFKHQSLKERLFQGFISLEHDLNYLVVYDDYKASHVSIYWVEERSDETRLELKWITDIFIKGGLKRIKKIFEGLKGETLEVRRSYHKFQKNPSQQQSKGFMNCFKNQHSNKGSCKDDALQMVSTLEGCSHSRLSNDEWKHIVGLQPCEPTKFWLLASYIQAITYSRTRYSSGLLLSTHTTEKYGLKCGSAQRNSRPDESKYVHDFEDVKSCAKFTKPPSALSSKCHDMFYWGGFK